MNGGNESIKLSDRVISVKSVTSWKGISSIYTLLLIIARNIINMRGVII